MTPTHHEQEAHVVTGRETHTNSPSSSGVTRVGDLDKLEACKHLSTKRLSLHLGLTTDIVPTRITNVIAKTRWMRRKTTAQPQIAIVVACSADVRLSCTEPIGRTTQQVAILSCIEGPAPSWNK